MFQLKHQFAKVCLFKYYLCQQEMNINISFNLIVETVNAAISGVAKKNYKGGNSPYQFRTTCVKFDHTS